MFKIEKLFLTVVLVVIGLLMSSPCICAEDQRLTIEKITNAWNAKESTIRSGRFEFQELRRVAKGSKSSPRRKQDPSKPIPEEDLSYVNSHSLTFDGAKVRLTSEGKRWSFVGGDLRLVDTSFVLAYDGAAERSYLPKGIYEYPAGTIEDANAFSGSKDIIVYPLFVAYRGSSKVLLPFDLDSFIATKETQVISGRQCVGLKSKPIPDVRGTESLWLDPERHFNLMRHATEVDGKVNSQLDVNYSFDAEHGWVPSGWRFVYYQSGGTFQESSEVTITSYALNTTIAPDTFAVEFPAQTIVNKVTQEGRSQYIVTENGEMKPLTAMDKSKSYAELQASLDQKPRGLRIVLTWAFLIAGICGLVMLGVYIQRSIRERRRIGIRHVMEGNSKESS